MPGDPFQFLSPNTPIDSGVGPFNLVWHNEVTRTLHSTRGQRDADNTAKNGAALPSGVSEIWIRNDSGGDLDQYSIVGIGDRVVAPRKTDSSHFGRAVFESVAPTAGDPFAIVQWPTADTVLCPAIISGPTVCRIQMDRTSHQYADAATGEYAALLSQPGVGPARILWADTDAATQLNGAINNSVTTITVDSTADFPDTPFTVLVGTEQIRVTATASATTFTVTRGYDGTTAASHSDNDAVAFYAGEVWATVLLGSSASEPEYHLGVTLEEIPGAISGTPGTGLAMYVKYADDGTGVMIHTLTDTTTTVRNDCTTPIASGRLVDILREPFSGLENARDRCAFATSAECPCAEESFCVTAVFQPSGGENVAINNTMTKIPGLCAWAWSGGSDTPGGESAYLSLDYTTGTWTLVLGVYGVSYYAFESDDFDCETGGGTWTEIDPGYLGYFPYDGDAPVVEPGVCADPYGGSGCADAATISTSGTPLVIDMGSAGEIWMKFAVANGPSYMISLEQTSGTAGDIYVYTGTCPDSLSQLIHTDGTLYCVTTTPNYDGYMYIRLVSVGAAEFAITVDEGGTCP